MLTCTRATNSDSSGGGLTPPGTVSDAVQRARAVLRQYRERMPERGTEPHGQHRVKVQLPLPCPSRKDDAVTVMDESFWPGGVQQVKMSTDPHPTSSILGCQLGAQAV